MDHFSHEHPLMLIDEAPKSEEKVVCYGCQKPISGSAYSCSACNYFLHNKCAQLSKEIKHPMHSRHSLTLFAKPPYYRSSCICNLCQMNDWKWFTYHCFRCEFDIHIPCILDEEEGLIEHECHEHPLMLVQRPALFSCDACYVEDKDLSYKCTTCPLWIHKKCASLPNTIKHGDHDHPLDLAYSLPEKFGNFTYMCSICHQKVHPIDWVYHCANCRHFVHLKCATAKKEPSLLRGEIKTEKDVDPNMMHFPMPDGSVTKIVQEVNSEDNEIGTELLHFSHHHPLHLSKATKDDDEIICNGCVRPISTPFYDCEQCDFCLHISCAELPRELQHPSHPHHPLSLQISDEDLSNSCLCDSCNIYSRGLIFSCESCKFYLDVNCATTSLPTTIKHEAHNHPLHLQTQPPPRCICNGCGRYFSNGFGFGCEACVFYLHYYCARLPRTISHSWDRHPITLIYPPFSDHPDEFICEICEEEMHPRHWIYHCRRCDQPFHYHCVHPFQKYSNFKFGGFFKNTDHTHFLALVQQSKNKSLSPCYDCGVCPYDIPFLECAPCNFIRCIGCVLHSDDPNNELSPVRRLLGLE